MSTRPIAVVTGGAGVIGSRVVDLLVERDYAVRAIDNLVGGCGDHPIRPQFPYARSRHQGKQTRFHWHNGYKPPVN